MKGKIEYSKDELIAGLRNKDNHILKHIIDSCHASIKQFILTNNGSKADAEDVLQESIIVLYRKTEDNNFELTSSISTFVISIARLIWLKELKTRKQRNVVNEFIDQIDEIDNIQDIIEKNERLKLYRYHFEQLKEDCKKVLRLFYLGTPMTQITKFMGYSSDDYTKKKKYTCKNALVNSIRNSKEYKELGYGHK